MVGTPRQFARYEGLIVFTIEWLTHLCLSVDYDKIGARYGRVFLWTTPDYYLPFQFLLGMVSQKYLEQAAGPFEMYRPAAIV